MVQADFVIPYYNRLERSGVDASERIAEMFELFHNQQLPTRILAASIKSPSDAVCALSAGAHDITAAPQVLLDMISDPQTDEAIEKCTEDWRKVNIKQGRDKSGPYSKATARVAPTLFWSVNQFRV